MLAIERLCAVRVCKRACLAAGAARALVTAAEEAQVMECEVAAARVARALAALAGGEQGEAACLAAGAAGALVGLAVGESVGGCAEAAAAVALALERVS